MIAQLLRHRGRSFYVDDVKPLYNGPAKSAIGTAGSVAKSIALKPFKKLLRTILFVATIRRAMLEAAEVLLLGHTLDRLLVAGWFAENSDAKTRNGQANEVYRAVNQVMASPERRGLVQLVRKSSRVLRRGGDGGEVQPPTSAVFNDDGVESALDSQQRRQLESASEELARKLAAEEGRSTLARIDAAIDRRLRR